jgi:hypothetical protein
MTSSITALVSSVDNYKLAQALCIGFHSTLGRIYSECYDENGVIRGLDLLEAEFETEKLEWAISELKCHSPVMR